MNRREALKLPIAAVLGAIARPSLSLADDAATPVRKPRPSDRIPDAAVLNHRGESLRFYSDLVADRPVVLNFMYVQCRGSCPGTSALLSRLWPVLDRALGPSLRLISITLDPEDDRPEQLSEYAKAYLPSAPLQSEWQFLTGTKEDIESLRRGLGYTDPDPRLDADRTQHASLLTFGNDALNRWASLPVGIPEPEMLRGMVRILRGYPPSAPRRL